MKKVLSTISLTVAALLMATTILIAAPVFADQGSDSNTSETTESTTSEHETTPVKPTTDSNTTAKTDNVPETESQDRQQGTELLSQLEKSGKHHTTEQVKTACETHKQGLTQKFSRISTELTNFNTRVDGILSKAEAYQKNNNVTVTNWDTLTAAAAAADTTSDSSIAAVKAVTPTVDCNKTSVAQDVATFKAAALQARSDLQSYKSAVRSVLKALQDAKHMNATTNNQQSTGGQQ